MVVYWMHQNNKTNINHHRGVTPMKSTVLAVVLLLAVGMSACDTEGFIEPAQGDAVVSAPSADKQAPPAQVITLNDIIGNPEGAGPVYVATGEIRYIMDDGPLASVNCNGYTIYFSISGTISEVPNDLALWAFQGAETVSMCVGNTSHALSLTCPISGRNDGASLRLDLMVTSSKITLEGLLIEGPGSELTTGLN
jgi:hypothetical protein